jgi:hypothetical protein
VKSDKVYEKPSEYDEKKIRAAVKRTKFRRLCRRKKGRENICRISINEIHPISSIEIH